MTKDTTDKGLFSRLGGHYGGGRYGYPPSYECTPCPPGGGYGYPPPGYPPPPPAGYPPAAYPYAAHTHHSGYVSSHTLLGGAAAAYGMQHHAHGGHHSAHKHHGYGQHSKFKHGKFGGRWKHGTAQVKFNKWK